MKHILFLISLSVCLTCNGQGIWRNARLGSVTVQAATAPFTVNAVTTSSGHAVKNPIAGGVGSDSKTITISFWCKPEAGYSNPKAIMYFGDWPILAVGRASGTMYILANNSAGNRVLDVSGIAIPDSVWTHVMFSCDMSDTGKRFCYTNGVNATAGVTWNTYSNSIIAWSRSGYSFQVGATQSDGDRFPGCMSEPFFSTAYTDLSVQANREKFIKDGDPQDPTSLSPIVYLHADYTDWGNNSGSLGAFSINGSLSTCTAP